MMLSSDAAKCTMVADNVGLLSLSSFVRSTAYSLGRRSIVACVIDLGRNLETAASCGLIWFRQALRRWLSLKYPILNSHNGHQSVPCKNLSLLYAQTTIRKRLVGVGLLPHLLQVQLVRACCFECIILYFKCAPLYFHTPIPLCISTTLAEYDIIRINSSAPCISESITSSVSLVPGNTAHAHAGNSGPRQPENDSCQVVQSSRSCRHEACIRFVNMRRCFVFGILTCEIVVLKSWLRKCLQFLSSWSGWWLHKD